MTIAVVLINLGILAFVLATGLGTRELRRRRFTLPVVVVAVVAACDLRTVPSSAGDLGLDALLGSAGVLLGVLAGRMMRVRRAEDGSLLTVSGGPYAAVWIAVIGGRLLFAYGAGHWFTATIAAGSRAFGIDGAAAWTSALVVMALAMVLARVAVTAQRALRALGGSTRGEELVGGGGPVPGRPHLAR